MGILENIFSNVGAWDAVKTTLILAISSTTISALIGIPLGLLLEKYDFFGKKVIVRINRTLMGVPPVVIGLLVYMLLMRKGPLGFLGMLFTVRGMILAQVLIITPIISGLVYSYAVKSANEIRNFAKTMGADESQTNQLIIKELKNEIYFSILTGFGRSISEVGAVMLVGGNIKYSTRTMTTAISLLKSQGIFEEGIILGVLLLLLSFILQSLMDYLRKEESKHENY